MVRNENKFHNENVHLKMLPVIYLRDKTADHSTTDSGISDFQIIYEKIADL